MVKHQRIYSSETHKKWQVKKKKQQHKWLMAHRMVWVNANGADVRLQWTSANWLVYVCTFLLWSNNRLNYMMSMRVLIKSTDMLIWLFPFFRFSLKSDVCISFHYIVFNMRVGIFWTKTTDEFNMQQNYTLQPVFVLIVLTVFLYI